MKIDLAGGRSTFMVEMTETANILHNATEQSLVLMDEVGRGTSTFDGLSLAWAVAEYLAKLKAFTLFATHYFELTTLPETLLNVANVHLKAAEYNDTIAFLHHVIEGPASQSYGLAVAKLAGVPQAVINRAKEHLAKLEATAIDTTISSQTLVNNIEPSVSAPIQADLFSSPTHPVIEELAMVNLNELTPFKALELLYAWQKKVK